MLAFFRIGFRRLLVELPFELAVAIAGIIALRAARKVLISCGFYLFEGAVGSERVG
jgi:hypothetical protein